MLVDIFSLTVQIPLHQSQKNKTGFFFKNKDNIIKGAH